MEAQNKIERLEKQLSDMGMSGTEQARIITELRAELKRWQDMNKKLLEQNFNFVKTLVEQDTQIKQLLLSVETDLLNAQTHNMMRFIEKALITIRAVRFLDVKDHGEAR